MSFFVLTKSNFKIRQLLRFHLENSTEQREEDASSPAVVSQSLYSYLRDIKCRLDVYAEDGSWDTAKKYTNPYEFIHTCVPRRRSPVCKHHPISRSFFKMTEMLHSFPAILGTAGPGSITTFHVAEGPGGFIEAVCGFRQSAAATSTQVARDVRNDRYIGMTLIDASDDGVPGWRKSRDFLAAQPAGRVSLEFGADGTGNILIADNLRHCVRKYGSGSMDLVTADGGFDFSEDFNHQEKNMIPLIFAETCFALSLQRRGGTFILKAFDCFLHGTLDVVFLLTAFYEKIVVVKPHTSRYANSERYLVCTGFLGASAEDIERIDRVFSEFADHYAKHPNAMWRFLDVPKYPVLFMKRMEECNSIFGQQQLETILATINLIESPGKTENMETLKRHHIAKCISFCKTHHLPFDRTLGTTTTTTSSVSSRASPDRVSVFTEK